LVPLSENVRSSPPPKRISTVSLAARTPTKSSRVESTSRVRDRSRQDEPPLVRARQFASLVVGSTMSFDVGLKKIAGWFARSGSAPRSTFTEISSPAPAA
jgi:hypothetical protein